MEKGFKGFLAAAESNSRAVFSPGVDIAQRDRWAVFFLPSGFHRIRHYGLLANTGRQDNLARIRELLHVAPAEAKVTDTSTESVQPIFVCPDCGAAMIIVEILARKQFIRAPPQQRGAP